MASDDAPFGIRCILKDHGPDNVWCGFLDEASEINCTLTEADEETGGQLADDGDNVTRRVAIARQSPEGGLVDRLRRIYVGLQVDVQALRAGSFGLRGRYAACEPSFAPVLAVNANGYTAHPLRFASLRRLIRACGHAFRSQSLATLCGGSGAACELQLRFVCYQLVRTVARAHRVGLRFASLSSASVLVSDRLWLEILPCFAATATNQQVVNPCRAPDDDVPITMRWVEGRMSNFEYLMLLNAAAGRGAWASADHAVLPWVSDFSVEWGGWRDLSKTKFRLTKGDAMLDRSFATSKHHVAEPALSELALCIYLARRAPISTLRRVVRANFVAEQYPASMQRLYEWSPDECVPEFFADANVFCSLHTNRGLDDLRVPPWCADASAFVTYHRALLESDHVSADLHCWIDLIFGYASRDSKAAEDNKNVPLTRDDPGLYDQLWSARAATGINRRIHYGAPVAKLFDSPHPRRKLASMRPASSGEVEARRARSLEAYLSLQPRSSRGVDAPPLPVDKAVRRARSDFDRALSENAASRRAQRMLASASGEDHASKGDQRRRDARALGLIIEELYDGCCVGCVPKVVHHAVDALLYGDVKLISAVTQACALEDTSSLRGSRRRKFGSNLDRNAAHLFPEYFHPTYAAISRLKRGPTRRSRVVALLDSLEAFVDLALAGTLLALPHVLETLDVPFDWGSPFDDDGVEGRSVAAELCAVVDALGRKLGVVLSSQTFLPRIAGVVEAHLLPGRGSDQDSVERRRAIFFHGETRRALSAGSTDGDELWRKIILRCGAAAFIRCVLPILVDVTLCGTPEDAATTTVRLMRDDALGAALVARFMLPVATAGLGKVGDGASVQHARECAYAPTPRAACVIALCKMVGVEPIAPLVLAPVLSSLAQLEGALSEPVPTKAARLALLELVSVMRRLISSLSANTVLHYYVRLAALNNNPLPRLLGALLPSTAALLDDDALADATLALNEVSALVSLVCLHVGEEVTVKSLLPDIDKFFAQLVHLHRSADEGTNTLARDAARRLALDVASVLYAPLASMLSFDVMRRHAPSARYLVEFAGHRPSSTNALDLSGGQSGNSSGFDQQLRADESKSHVLRAGGVLDHASRRAIDWGHDALDWLMRINPAHHAIGGHGGLGTGASPAASQRYRSQQTQHRADGMLRRHSSEDVATKSSTSAARQMERQAPQSSDTAAVATNEVSGGVLALSTDEDHPLVPPRTTEPPLQSVPPRSAFHEGDGMELHELRDARCDAENLRPRPTRLRQRKATWRRAEDAALPTLSLPGDYDVVGIREACEENVNGGNELSGRLAGDDVEEVVVDEDEFELMDEEDEDEEDYEMFHAAAAEIALGEEEEEEDMRRARLEEEDEDDDDLISGTSAGRPGLPANPAVTTNKATPASPLQSWRPHEAVDGSRTKQLGESVDAGLLSRRARDDGRDDGDDHRLWLLGGFLCVTPNQIEGGETRPWEQIKGAWAPKLCVSSRPLQPSDVFGQDASAPALPQRRRRGASCVLAVDSAESMVLVGGRDGAVRIWSLRERPRADAQPVAIKREPHLRRVRSLFSLDGDGNGAISSDGALFDYWDVETGAALRRWLWTTEAGLSSSTSWRGANLQRIVDLAPLPLGYAAGGALSPSHASRTQHIVALAERSLALVDLRAPRTASAAHFDLAFGAAAVPRRDDSFSDQHEPAIPLFATSGGLCGESTPVYVGPPPPGPPGDDSTPPATKQMLNEGLAPAATDDNDATARCVVSSPTGRWLAVGSAGGRLLVLDRIAGRVLASWAAHGPGVPIVKLVAFDDHDLLSVGADRIVTLWRVSATPRALGFARLDFRFPVQPNTVQATRFDDGTTLILAASGHKLAVARLGRHDRVRPPLPFSQPTAQVAVRRANGPIQGQRRHFFDDRGQRLHRHSFLIGSLAVLPLRRALLLGCEDGSVRVAL